MANNWVERAKKFTFNDEKTNFAINFAGMKFDESQLDNMSELFAKAQKGMKDIEAGVIKNPDENRQVTHFTDRIAYAKSQLFKDVELFVEDVRSGKILSSTNEKFDALVVNGIGGSALGPQLMQFAINGPYFNELSAEARKGYLKIYFLDNTDAAGVTDVAQVMNAATTLHLCISKSGGTQETKNNLTAIENIYKAKGLDFCKHSVAITMLDSNLDKYAKANNYLKVFEMAESIGGRTSETSIVGHLAAALTGVDFADFLNGACTMDELTRSECYMENPAMMLAAMWYIASNGKGDRNMVIVPYSDRLVLLSRYLQQLVMESLGKEFDLDGKLVNQGLNVFGNKGGTDAHAFIQQLNDGRDDFFITFIEVLKDADRLPITSDINMGDYLHGFLEGLSLAFRNTGRQVISMKIAEINTFNLGMIIALYERAVAIYAEFVNINAFHQPGVQAYKLAAKDILDLREKLFSEIAKLDSFKMTAQELAEKFDLNDYVIEIANLLDKESFNSEVISREYCKKCNVWVYIK